MRSVWGDKIQAGLAGDGRKRFPGSTGSPFSRGHEVQDSSFPERHAGTVADRRMEASSNANGLVT